MRFIFRFFTVLGLALILAGCSGVRVKKGDTLYSISRKHDVPIRALIEENNLKPPYTLSIGQYLYFPRTKTYRVRKSDTLYSIATRHGMTVSSLAKLNNIPPPYIIHQGQLLKISSWVEEDKKPVAQKQSPRTAKVSQASGSVAEDRQAEIARRKNVKDPAAFQGKASVPKSQKNKRFAWPVSGKVITPFGSGNDGINIGGSAGTLIKAADAGTVAYAGSELK